MSMHILYFRSGHELIVVDIQGVGDLYTDPQIHTARGKREHLLCYGDSCQFVILNVMPDS